MGVKDLQQFNIARNDRNEIALVAPLQLCRRQTAHGAENFVADLIRGIVREDRELTEQASWCRFPPAPFYLVNFIFSSDSIWKISESRREKTLKAVKNFIGLSLTKYDTLTVLLQKTDYVTLVFTGGTGEIQEKSFIKKLSTL